MKKLAGTVFFMICLGCVPVENRPPIDLVAARGMTPGTTTKDQAIAALGQPYATSKHDGKTSLIWGWTKVKPSDNTWVSNTVVALFDGAGVLVEAPKITETEKKPAGK